MRSTSRCLAHQKCYHEAKCCGLLVEKRLLLVEVVVRAHGSIERHGGIQTPRRYAVNAKGVVRVRPGVSSD